MRHRFVSGVVIGFRVIRVCFGWVFYVFVFLSVLRL